MSPSPGFEALVPLLYDELRAIARRQLRHDRVASSLQPTELVHEAFLRLERAQLAAPEDRAEVLALSATMMRRLLVDHARRRGADKRGGGWVRVLLHDEIGDAMGGGLGDGTDILALDQALRRLEELDPRSGRIVHLKFFGGLREAEIAAQMGISERWVRQQWSHARAWLGCELDAPASG